ncbi:MAG: hypothetical protein N3G74_02240 [Candidatus Micrarchaeota archaeon]|nr:hypothetical protein [Candidatus Micrarchaeota archaeon]
MPSLAVKEEEEKEKKRREEEKKKKEQESKEQLHHHTEAKKEAAKGELKGSPFGEAKPIIEVGYMKVHIKGTLASEKYEPIVKESLAVKTIEEEKKREMQKEREKLSDEIQKIEENIRKDEELIKHIQEERKKEREKTAKEKELKAKERVEREKIREKIKQEKEQIKKLLEEAKKKGLIEPIQDIAKELLEREIKKGTPPRKALQTVLIILKRLGLVKTKKEKKSIFSFLRSILKKK